MEIKKAAEATEAKVMKGNQGQFENSNLDTDKSHLLWMLDGIIKGYIKHDKAHRWLSYVQGVICAFGIVSVDDLKEINKHL